MINNFDNEAYTLEETGLFTEGGNVRAIVVRKHFVAQNGVGDLRSSHQIHFQQARLQMALLRLVLLQCVQQERRRLLDHVVLHKNIHNLE